MGNAKDTFVTRLLNAIAKFLTRIFMPGMARDMATEGHFDFRDKNAEGGLDLSQFIDIEDNGSDVTIVSFAGMAVLWAGLPKFEFRKLLHENGVKYNLVFVRDVQRACYFLGPDSRPDGLAFYQKIVRDALEQLGSKYNIALGASVGGAGAFYISHSMPIHQVVTFAPAFPQQVYLEPANRRKVFYDFKKLFHEPAAYFELVLVTLAAGFVYRKLLTFMREEDVPDVTQAYLSSRPAPPPATIFYGERSWPDVDQALRHRDIPSVTIKPIDSGRHNCAGDLKKRGILGEVLLGEIEAGVTAWRARERTALAAASN